MSVLLNQENSKTYPVYQGPVPSFDKEGEFVQKPAQETIPEDNCIRSMDHSLEAQERHLSFSPLALLRR